jgi:hypothetical protein
MGASAKLKRELVALALAWVYFAAWFGFLIVLKKLTLEEYQIAFAGLSVVLVSALILAKVVLILEHVPLGRWVAARPAWVDVALRTVLYALGVVVVLILERGVEGRHEHGGFAGAVRYVAAHADAHHIWINTLCVTSALLGYNVLAVVRRHLGPGGLPRLFTVPVPEEPHP